MNNLTRGSRTGLAVFLLLASASFFTADSHAGKLPASAAPQRGYYLTKDLFDGSQPLTACATGYHMASLWEIHEPSNLRYDESLGLTQGDGGPPTYAPGWIRLGFDVTQSDAFYCSDSYSPAWTLNLQYARGASAYLVHPYLDLDGVTVVDRSWAILRRSCDTPTRVWCVQD